MTASIYSVMISILVSNNVISFPSGQPWLKVSNELIVLQNVSSKNGDLQSNRHAQDIRCLCSDGVTVYSYGAWCKAGNVQCIPNPCPPGPDCGVD